MMVLPGKVVSLLEILQSYADAYAKLAHVAAAFICRLRYVPEFEDSRRQQLVNGLEEALPHCERSELTLTAVHLLRLLNDVKAGVDRSELSAKLIELESRLEDELKTKLFFQLPLSKRDYFENPRKGWDEVIQRFPDSVMDIEEMRKCFALSRYPACVFHSVNAVEAGLVGLGNFIGVRDPKSGWTPVTAELERLVVKTKYPDLGPKFQNCFPFLEQTHATCVALKSAWRNKISHTQGRLAVMTADFSPDVAEEIIVASRAFMRRLSTEMP
jgi:hypothetical protein